MKGTYQILDEPTSRDVGQFVTNPFWPMLAAMLGGAWLGCILFGLNAWFLRGPTWRRELVLLIVMLLGSPLILFGIFWAMKAGDLADRWFKYAILGIVVWKLSIMYWVFFMQQSAHALYEYFESARLPSKKVPFGLGLLAAGFFLKSQVLNAVDSDFWYVMVS